jgi:autotransporter-associated beta strand protein
MLTMSEGMLYANVIDMGGTHTISAPMLLDSTLNVDVENAGDTMNLSGSISGPGGLIVNSVGTVALSGQNSYQGTTLVEDGTLTIQSSASLPATTSLTVGNVVNTAVVRLAAGSGTATVAGLSITSGSTVDITSNALIVDFTPGNDPAATIRGYLQTGYNGGKWNGAGITSGNAAADPGLYAVGYADGSTDAGTPAAANQIYIRNTLAGDANLDGIVNFPDLLLVAQNYGKTGQDWAHGDFNYDGVVNFPDLLLVAQNYGKQLSAGQLTELPGSFAAQWQLAQAEILSNPTGVPEPSMIGLLFVGAITLSARRRRAV